MLLDNHSLIFGLRFSDFLTLDDLVMPVLTPPKRCVIADDVRASRESVGNWLKECAFECKLAENGQQAWEMILDQPPDLIITDLEMPYLCGLELLERTRQSDDDRISEVPVLVMTSLRDAQTCDIVRKLGGDGLLLKPLDKHTTFSMILDLVSGRHSFPGFVQPGDEANVQGSGVVSPTLRRLLKTVADKERL